MPKDTFLGINTIKVKQSHLDSIGEIIKNLHDQAKATAALRVTVPVKTIEQLFTLFHTL